MTDYKSHLLKFVNSLIELPRNPKQCADLITRARALLGRRDNQEIEIIDDNITCVIDDFTNELKAQHGGNYHRHMATVLKLDINNKKELLKYCLYDYDYPNISDITSTATMCDYFSVFSVRYVAIAHLTATGSPPKGLSESEKAAFRTEQTQQSFDFIYSACECIAYAEQLSHTEKLIIKNDALEFENKQLKDNHNLELEKAGKKAISQSKSLAAKKSHAKDYKEQARVNDWLHKNDKYVMGNTANKIAGDLFKLDIFRVSFNTLLKYISAYKNERLEKLSIQTKIA